MEETKDDFGKEEETNEEEIKETEKTSEYTDIEDKDSTKKEIDDKGSTKKESRSNLTFFAILAVIAILFIAAFSVKMFIKPKSYTMEDMIAKTFQGEENPETNYKYNGFVFVKVGPLWYTQWQLENYMLNIPLHYGPLELQDVKAEGKLDERFNSDKYYITFDPYGQDFAYVALAAGEIGRNLVEGLGAKIESACISNHTACEGKKIITCENTNSSVIYLKESDDAKIIMQGNCLILQGKQDELIKVVDRVILQLYSIMD